MHWFVNVPSNKFSCQARLFKENIFKWYPSYSPIYSKIPIPMSTPNSNTHAFQHFNRLSFPFSVYITSANEQSIRWTGGNTLQLWPELWWTFCIVFRVKWKIAFRLFSLLASAYELLYCTRRGCWQKPRKNEIIIVIIKITLDLCHLLYELKKKKSM